MSRSRGVWWIVGACAAAVFTILVVIGAYVLGASWTTDPLAVASFIVATATSLVAFWALAAAIVAARYGYQAARYALAQLVVVLNEQSRVLAEVSRRPELVIGFDNHYAPSTVSDEQQRALSDLSKPENDCTSFALEKAGLRRGGMAFRDVDVYELGFTLKNIGQRTARDIVVSVRFPISEVCGMDDHLLDDSDVNSRVEDSVENRSRRDWIVSMSALNPKGQRVLTILLTPWEGQRGRSFVTMASLSMADEADVDFELSIAFEPV
jgi:hypothetical protein